MAGLTYELIKESEAPPPPKAINQETENVVAMLRELKPGMVAKVPLPEGRSPKGVRVGFGRIAANNGFKGRLKTWDDGTFIYLKLQ